MANIKGKVKTLAMVKNVVNVKNCTNFGCMAIDGKKAWGLKTASGNEYSVVHYCSDVNDKVSLRYTTPKGLLGHGNCMTCSNSNLLFGVSNGLNGENYIVRVPRGFKGDWDRKVIFKSEKKIPALAFYSNYHYLIRVGDSPENQRARFGIGVLEGQNTANPTVKYDSSNEFYINTKWTYKHVQDIHYEPSKGLLFPTMKSQGAAKNEANNAAQETKPVEKIDFSKVKVEPLFEEMVDFDTFSKSDFRAVKVKACEAVKKSKKLLQFTLDDGTGTDRTILSGIHAYYEPEELVGKTLIAITNLPPRAMMGIDSCGMLLSAIHEEEGEEKLHLLMVDDHIPAGAKLY